MGTGLDPVGVLDFEVRPDKQHAAFRYVDEWLENPRAFAIAPSMPLTKAASSSGREPSIEAAVEAAPLFKVAKEEAMADSRRMGRIVAQRWRGLCAKAGMNRSECDVYSDAFRRANALVAR